MKFKPCIITHIQQVINLMVAGDVCWYKGCRILFDPHYLGNSPFRVIPVDGISSHECWTNFMDWQIEDPVSWEDHASKQTPIICKVSNDLYSEIDIIRYIVAHCRHTNTYTCIAEFDGDNTHWAYATPLAPTDCYHDIIC